MKKYIGSLIVWIMLVSITNAAVLSFQPNKVTLPANCTWSVDIFLDTRWQKTLGTEFILQYDTENIEIIWVEDGWLYDMPIASKKEWDIFYYSTTNLWEKYFSRWWKLWSLILKPKTNVKETELKFVFEQGNSKDSNVVNSNFEDVLTSVVNAKIKFEEDGECKFEETEVFQEKNLTWTKEEIVEKIVDDINQAHDSALAKEKSKFWNKYLSKDYILIMLIIIALWSGVYLIRNKK